METFAAKAREPFKTALAIVISYGIALAMDWDNPYWAASQRSVDVATIQCQEGSITFNTLITTLAANTQQQDLLSATRGTRETII